MKLIFKYIKKYKKFIFLNFIAVFGIVLIEIGIPTILETWINNTAMNHDGRYIMKMALLMLVFAIIGLLMLLVLAYSTNRLVTSVTREMRNDIFKKTQEFSHDEYEKFGISRLITNVVNDSYIITQFLTMFLRTGLIAPTLFFVSFFMVYRNSPKLAMVILVSVPIMMIAIYFINKKTEPMSVKQQIQLDDINRNMRESLTGLRVIRAFNREDFQAERFDDVNTTYSKTSKSMFKTVAFISPIFTIVFTFVIAMVVKLGVGQINDGLIQFGTLAAQIEYVFHALFSFLVLANVFTMYPRASVAANRIKEVLDQTATIHPNPEGISVTETEGVIEFKDVSFAYADSSEEFVIKHVNFTAKPGETVAFIGSTGSGKSTLIQLIPRFFDTTYGDILIDGVNVKDYNLKTLRQKIGYVPQKTTLFSGTILENIKFGNNNASMEEVEEAVRIAQAEEFISSKELGYQDLIAEGGTNLSGGQKQRLCIARALVRKPSIYIFEDSFSALDFKTDALLRKQLRTVTHESTVLIVAQRVSTIMDADKIVVLNKGEVVGTGTHQELLKSSDIYYEIAASQLTKEELENERL